MDFPLRRHVRRDRVTVFSWRIVVDHPRVRRLSPLWLSGFRCPGFEVVSPGLFEVREVSLLLFRARCLRAPGILLLGIPPDPEAGVVVRACCLRAPGMFLLGIPPDPEACWALPLCWSGPLPLGARLCSPLGFPGIWAGCSPRGWMVPSPRSRVGFPFPVLCCPWLSLGGSPSLEGSLSRSPSGFGHSWIGYPPWVPALRAGREARA